MINHVLLLLFCTFLIGCVNPTAKRFPHLPDQISNIENKDIDLFVDVMVLSDIRGTEKGVDENTNDKAKKLISNSLSESLSRRGYTPNIVYLGPALTYKRLKDEDVQLMTAENWKSTGDEYVGPRNVSENKFEYSESLTAYLDALVTDARNANNDQSTNSIPDEANTRVQSILADNPELLGKLQSDLFLYVSVTGLDVSSAKQFGLALLSSGVGVSAGGVTATFTGNYSPKGTSHEYVLLHRPTSEILWHYLPMEGNRLDYIDETFESHIKYLPGASGEYVAAKRVEAL